MSTGGGVCGGDSASTPAAGGVCGAGFALGVGDTTVAGRVARGCRAGGRPTSCGGEGVLCFCCAGRARTGGIGVAGLICASDALAAKRAPAAIADAPAKRLREELREPIFNGFSSRKRTGPSILYSLKSVRLETG
ncbi:Hypothetical protein BN69_3561 [Methylocystis sp. SC2]|nr:Hypothetical protein BN69_3561 [Methylocystis sp. SC2]